MNYETSITYQCNMNQVRRQVPQKVVQNSRFDRKFGGARQRRQRLRVPLGTQTPPHLPGAQPMRRGPYPALQSSKGGLALGLQRPRPRGDPFFDQRLEFSYRHVILPGAIALAK